jgi:hypothetical protein
MSTLDTHLALELLRAPREVAAKIGGGQSLRAFARLSIPAIVLGMAAYGGTAGSARGGAQVIYAATKMPLVALLVLSLVAPVLFGASRALGRPIAFAQAAALVLAATARMSLVLLALAPIVGLLLTLTGDYHDAIMLSTLGFALAGLSGLSLLWHGIGRGDGRLLLAVLVVGAFALVGAQSAWVLRPWIARPSAPMVFMRPPEGAVIEEVFRSARSATGDYDAERAAERAAERSAFEGSR